MVGRTLGNDRYEVLELLGEGAAARVYRARDHLLGRDVALKALRPELASEPGAADRFRREATAAAGLSHANIAQVYDIGVDPEGVPYFVMELVPGGTLRDLLDLRGKLAPEEALDITRQIASALRHAHESGIVHRDIKPLNCLIGRDGQVKVVDFGIARALAQTQMTQAGNIVGSVRYVSPEQAKGEMATPQSDLYSLGVILFELLTGQPPYDGDTPVAIALKHAEGPTPKITTVDPSIPAPVAAIVERAMAKDPTHRYLRAAEMLGDIEAWESASPAPAAPAAASRAYEATTVIERPTLPPRPQPQHGGRSPLAEPAEPDGMSTLTWVLVLLTLVVVVSGIGILWVLRQGKGTEADDVESPPTMVVATMPQIEGLTRPVALRLLREAGVDENSVFIEEQEDEDATPNIVVRQYPTQGAQWHQGDRVTLVVTKKPEEPLVDSVETPELVGRDVETALEILRYVDLVADIMPDAGAEGEPGEVVDQAPRPGDLIPIGETVRLYVVPEDTDEPDEDEPVDEGPGEDTPPEQPDGGPDATEPAVPIAPPPSESGDADDSPAAPDPLPTPPDAPPGDTPADRPEPEDL
jgi:serine/threonine-protein kinase